MTIESAVETLKDIRHAWKINDMGSIEFSALEGKLFRQFKQEFPATWENDWPLVQRKARE